VTQGLAGLDTIFSLALEDKVPRNENITAWAFNTATYFQNEYLLYKREKEERAKKLVERYGRKGA
jgi:hypothetical protein